LKHKNKLKPLLSSFPRSGNLLLYLLLSFDLLAPKTAQRFHPNILKLINKLKPFYPPFRAAETFSFNSFCPLTSSPKKIPRSGNISFTS
jgi:hypothetical protein